MMLIGDTNNGITCNNNKSLEILPILIGVAMEVNQRKDAELIWHQTNENLIFFGKLLFLWIIFY